MQSITQLLAGESNLLHHSLVTLKNQLKRIVTYLPAYKTNLLLQLHTSTQISILVRTDMQSFLQFFCLFFYTHMNREPVKHKANMHISPKIL